MTLAALVTLLVVLLVFGAILYIISLVPIDATVKRIIYVLAVLVLCIWIITSFLVPLLGKAGR